MCVSVRHTFERMAEFLAQPLAQLRERRDLNGGALPQKDLHSTPHHSTPQHTTAQHTSTAHHAAQHHHSTITTSLVGSPHSYKRYRVGERMDASALCRFAGNTVLALRAHTTLALHVHTNALALCMHAALVLHAHRLGPACTPGASA